MQRGTWSNIGKATACLRERLPVATRLGAQPGQEGRASMEQDVRRGQNCGLSLAQRHGVRRAELPAGGDRVCLFGIGSITGRQQDQHVLYAVLRAGSALISCVEVDWNPGYAATTCVIPL